MNLQVCKNQTTYPVPVYKYKLHQQVNLGAEDQFRDTTTKKLPFGILKKKKNIFSKYDYLACLLFTCLF